MYEQIGTSTIAAGIVQPAPFPRGDGEDVLEQPSATIETTVYPGNVIREIGLLMNPSRGDPAQVFQPYEGPQMLRIEQGDIVLYPRTKNEIHDMFGIQDPEIQRYMSSTGSAFSVFNGKRRVPTDDLHKYYKFLGLARSSVDFTPSTDFVKLSVASSGVMDWVNYSDTMVEPFAPMTWSLIGVPYTVGDAYVSTDYGTYGGTWAPPEKRRHTRTNVIKPVFVKAEHPFDTVAGFDVVTTLIEVFDTITPHMTPEQRRAREAEEGGKAKEKQKQVEATSTSSAPSPEAQPTVARQPKATAEEVLGRSVTLITGLTTDRNFPDILTIIAETIYRIGVREASRHSSHIIGKNAGKPVHPGKTGQIILF